MTRNRLAFHAAAAGVLAAACTTLSASAQNVFDDFTSGTDAGWTHNDGYALLYGQPSTYRVSGGAYRITTPTVLFNGAYPYVGAVRSGTLASNSVVSVDVVDWSGQSSFGLGARLQADYSFYGVYFTPVSLLQNNASNFRIIRHNFNASTYSYEETIIAGGTPFPQVDQNQDYRITFTLSGTSLWATLTNIQTGALVSSLSVVDDGAGSFQGAGLAGLNLITNGGGVGSLMGGYSATFDNFSVTPVPGPGAAALGAIGLMAARRRRRSTR